MLRLNIKALKQLLPILILCIGTFMVSCGGDDDMEPGGGSDPIDCSGLSPSYMNDIKPIIDATCALAGCHEANFLQGDFSAYEGLKDKATDGTLNNRAVVSKDMPPEGTNGPAELTETQIQLIHCWIQDGAPNN